MSKIIIKKIPSTKVTDIAKAINDKSKIRVIGIRPSEKIHEEMISNSEARDTIDYNSFFLIIYATGSPNILLLIKFL